jgi:hypothetical protein
MKDELKNTVIVLFLDKPLIFTEDTLDFNWLKFTFIRNKINQNLDNAKIIDNSVIEKD